MRAIDPTPDEIAERARQISQLASIEAGLRPAVVNGKHAKPCKNRHCRKSRSTAEAFSYGSDGPCEDCWVEAQGVCRRTRPPKFFIGAEADRHRK